MAKCLDCGYCGFFMNIRQGLRWYEMNFQVRKAIEQGEEMNPPGNDPGTRHLDYIGCIKSVHEWNSGGPSDLRDALLKTRRCRRFFEYQGGFSPREHYARQAETINTNFTRWNGIVAWLALILSAINLVYSLFFRAAN